MCGALGLMKVVDPNHQNALEYRFKRTLMRLSVLKETGLSIVF